jgi:predicted flap endonuclease-1-like 5' DNA nuclease
MSYLIAWHWGWLLAALIIGCVVGFATVARPRARWLDGPSGLALLVFALAIIVALARLLPGRPGYWLDLGVLMVAAYLIGCLIGWLVKFASTGSEPALATAGAVGSGTVAARATASAAPVAAAREPAPQPAEPQAAPALPDEAAHAGQRPAGYLAARAAGADDLKRIKGIGRQNEARLNALGIWHFQQIADWTPDNVTWVGSYLAFPGRIDREDWVAQAKVLAAGGDTEFSKRVKAGEVPTSKDE